MAASLCEGNSEFRTMHKATEITPSLFKDNKEKDSLASHERLYSEWIYRILKRKVFVLTDMYIHHVMVIGVESTKRIQIPAELTLLRR